MIAAPPPAVREPASFRDPAGFVYRDEDGTLLRQVNRGFHAEYRMLMESGLYQDLLSRNLLIEHEEVSLSLAQTEDGHCVLRPRHISFISYPYEWSFTALKRAALLTLDIQLRALSFGMSLKDASAYNIQFEGTEPIFIDTLSFEPHRPGTPWGAYGQFCRHFLAPLALMSRSDVRLQRLLANHLDGIPLDLCSRLLPWRTRLRPGLFLHLHLHASLVRRHGDTSKDRPTRPANISRSGLEKLLVSLRATVEGLAWKGEGTEWADYYACNSYTSDAFEAKQSVVADYIRRARPQTAWDLGANTGTFSRLAVQAGARTCAFDIDPACVELNYRRCRDDSVSNLTPLLLDLTNPSPAIGWSHEERQSLIERGPVDLVMALALVHHLAIGNNVPLGHIANFLRRIGRRLIVEFIPKCDPQVRRLLRSRSDVFESYNQQQFEAEFSERFRIADFRPVGTDGRVIYFMEAR